MKALKYLLSLFLIIFMVIPSFSSLIAFAADEDEDAAYIYDHVVAGNGYTGKRYQYASIYVPDYIYDGKADYQNIFVFTLYDTVNKAVVPAYCTDILTMANAEKSYRRLNLEDSTYAGTAAGYIRSILNEGFYLEEIEGESDTDHRARADQKLKELGTAAGVDGLTASEAICATQTAIWQTAHGKRLEFPNFVRKYLVSNKSAVRYSDLCFEDLYNGHVSYGSNYSITAESAAYVNERIKTVFDYLTALAPTEPEEKIVSTASFTKIQEPVRIENPDGTYNISVTARIDVSMKANDNLTFSAVIDKDNFASTPLSNGEQIITLTIKNVSKDIAFNDVTLNIDGLQTAHDAFLFEPKGGRTDSQCMVGIPRIQSPIHANLIAQSERKVNIYKTTLIATGGGEIRYPLQGIIFDIYRVKDEYTVLPTPEDYIAANIAPKNQYSYAETPDFVIVTDENGRGTINMTQHNAKDGVYIVIEREHPAIEAPIDPFYIRLPAINNGQYEYEVDLQPKNNIKGNAFIEKDVLGLGSNQAVVDVYAPHQWIIGTNVPVDIEQGKHFAITDTLDNRLDLVGNIKVNLENVHGNTVVATLTEGTDYTLKVTDVDSLSEGNPSDSFTVTLTTEGMANIVTLLGTNNFEDYRIRVYFDAKINSNASVGEEIPNIANLNYTNSVNFTFNMDSEGTGVSTGGALIKKVDADNTQKVLQGAIFEVYREATPEDYQNTPDAITHIEGVTPAVIKVSFFDNPDLSGEIGHTATSGTDGKAYIFGLAYGNYYLIETKAPAGYTTTNAPIPFIIDSTSHTEEKAFVIGNTGGGGITAILPSTGGIGTNLFIYGGLTLVLISIILLVAKKRVNN